MCGGEAVTLELAILVLYLEVKKMVSNLLQKPFYP